jgi:hypothetical protein
MSLQRATRLSRITPLRSSAGLSRSPWSRSVPLAGTGKGKSAARTGSGSSSSKLVAPAPGEFTARVKRLVRRRAGRGDPFDARCEGCWKWLGIDAGEFQHRAARGAGGCRDGVVNGPANCLLLCRSCHWEAEERRRDLSQDGAGFWIGHGSGPDYDPRLAAVMLGALGDSGVTVWLAADGLGPDGTGYLLQPPSELAA